MFTTVESSGLMAGCSARLLCFSAGISCSCTVVSGQLHWIGGFRNYFLGLGPLFGLGLLFGLLFGCSAVLAAIDVALFVFPRTDTIAQTTAASRRDSPVSAKSSIGSMAFRDNDS